MGAESGEAETERGVWEVAVMVAGLRERVEKVDGLAAVEVPVVDLRG